MDDFKKIDWYSILGCNIESTREEIQRAARKLSLKYHSDKTDDPDAPAKFLEVQKAKEVLLDDEKRKQIDEVLKASLKRKEYDSHKRQEMNEQRKKMKEKLEKSVHDARVNLSNLKSSGTHTSSVPKDDFVLPKSSSSSKSKSHIDQLKKDATMKMEEMAQKRQAEEKKKHDEYINSLYQRSETARTIKIKWKPSRAESHSEDSLYVLLKQFGEIDDIILDEKKGTSAKVIFSTIESAEKCISYYEYSNEYRVKLADKKSDSSSSSSIPSVYTFQYNKSSSTTSANVTSTTIPSSSSSSSSHSYTETCHVNTSSMNNAESVLKTTHLKSDIGLMEMMRKTIEKEKLKSMLTPSPTIHADKKESSIYGNTSNIDISSSTSSKNIPRHNNTTTTSTNTTTTQKESTSTYHHPPLKTISSSTSEQKDNKDTLFRIPINLLQTSKEIILEKLAHFHQYEQRILS